VGSGSLDGQPLVVLEDFECGRRLQVALHGGAVVSFSVRVNGVTHELAEGYRSGAEIAGRPGSRFALLAPFPGRVADARYHFDGHAQDLDPGVTGAARASRHGFVRDADFELVASAADDDHASVTLATQAIRPRPGYPFSIDLAVTFTLAAVGLTLEARMRNVGDDPAPCYFGWHPYWRVGTETIAEWELCVPAQTLIRTDTDMIVLPGAAAYVPVDDVPALDYREPRRLADSILDQGYTDLAADADGRMRTRLRNPATGLGLALWQERGVMHVYTADTLARDARKAVALEPMECMANAFNRPECADAIRLRPGAERVFRCGVELEIAP
jgi:aldose 1-epimerase